MVGASFSKAAIYRDRPLLRRLFYFDAAPYPVLACNIVVVGANSGIGVHSPFGYHINGTGGPVFAIEFGIFTPKALFALVLFIFGTAVWGLPCAVSFTGAHVVSLLLDLPIIKQGKIWGRMSICQS